MENRSDSVTSPCSSSFILARKGGLNQEQKDAVVDFVERNFLGEELLTPGMSEEEIRKRMEESYNFDTAYEEKARAALQDGMSICDGYVTFEECEYHITDLYQELWDLLERKGDGNFRVISGDLAF